MLYSVKQQLHCFIAICFLPSFTFVVVIIAFIVKYPTIFCTSAPLSPVLWMYLKHSCTWFLSPPVAAICEPIYSRQRQPTESEEKSEYAKTAGNQKKKRTSTLYKSKYENVISYRRAGWCALRACVHTTEIHIGSSPPTFRCVVIEVAVYMVVCALGLGCFWLAIVNACVCATAIVEEPQCKLFAPIRSRKISFQREVHVKCVHFRLHALAVIGYILLRLRYKLHLRCMLSSVHKLEKIVRAEALTLQVLFFCFFLCFLFREKPCVQMSDECRLYCGTFRVH